METPGRNLKRDLIVALVTISMLAIAVVFTLLLSADSLQGPAPTQTSAAMLPTTRGIAPSPTATQPPETPPTEIPTTAAPAPSATATLKPTVESPASPTATSVKPTPIPPSSTHTPTRMPSPTATNRPPTATATDTPTDAPTATPTATSTASPTRTAKPPESSPTLQLATPITPSPTASDTTACTFPAGWRPYTIQSGDNLFRLSLRAGIPLTEMQRANCISNAAAVEVGQTIYAPPAFFSNTPSALPTNSAPVDEETNIPLQEGCTTPYIQISYPAPGAQMTTFFTVRGTATLSNPDDFSFYKVELRREGDLAYRNVQQSNTPVTNGDLAGITPAYFGSGVYQLVLTVVDVTGNYPQPCAIRVVFP